MDCFRKELGGMTTLSELFPNSAIKSIQTGYVDSSGSASSGSGEDTKYFDVTISSVTAANCVCFFFGAAAGSLSVAQQYATNAYIVSPKITSATNLRLSAGSGTYIVGRWYVVEYN